MSLLKFKEYAIGLRILLKLHFLSLGLVGWKFKIFTMSGENVN